MPSDLDLTIQSLEQTNDPAKAYFAFTVDRTGDYGTIRANKEGLRLFAAEMLKKSIRVEQQQDGEPLFFGNLEWIICDAGYELITGIEPEYRTREEIREKAAEALSKDPELDEEVLSPDMKKQVSGKGCLGSIGWILIGSLILMAAVKAFPKLQAWVNIH